MVEVSERPLWAWIRELWLLTNFPRCHDVVQQSSPDNRGVILLVIPLTRKLNKSISISISIPFIAISLKEPTT